ncbi:MAG: hypothetical protein ACLFPL_03620 [Candidatus Nanoarchaeia archaeon]
MILIQDSSYLWSFTYLQNPEIGNEREINSSLSQQCYQLIRNRFLEGTDERQLHFRGDFVLYEAQIVRVDYHFNTTGLDGCSFIGQGYEFDFKRRNRDFKIFQQKLSESQRTFLSQMPSVRNFEKSLQDKNSKILLLAGLEGKRFEMRNKRKYEEPIMYDAEEDKVFAWAPIDSEFEKLLN